MTSELDLERLSDEQLATRAQAGDRRAFVVLIERWDERLFNFLLRRCSHREDAEDLTQETLTAAWAQIMRYDDRWRFSTWLFTIGGRLAASAYRDSSRMRLVRVDTSRVAAPDGPDLLESREEAARLWALADQLLTPRQRAALWLRYAEELPIADIATVLGMTAVAVRVSLHRARQALARHEGNARVRRRLAQVPKPRATVHSGVHV